LLQFPFARRAIGGNFFASFAGVLPSGVARGNPNLDRTGKSSARRNHQGVRIALHDEIFDEQIFPRWVKTRLIKLE